MAKLKKQSQKEEKPKKKASKTAAEVTPPEAQAVNTGSGKSAKKTKKTSKAKDQPQKLTGKAKVLKSKEVYRGKVFWVTHDKVREPGDVTATRDVVRHNGSVVILAIDSAANPADPDIVLIRQYRYAAEKFLLELPAGRIEPGEKLIRAAKRELAEETGYTAKTWSKHVTYYASPGFVSESMTILFAEDLTLGEATPEEDEKIEIRLTPLSEALQMIHKGEIEDGKTLIGILLLQSERVAQ